MTVLPLNRVKSRSCVTLNGSGIQLAVGPQPLWLRNHDSGPAQRIMVKRLATSPHDPLGITHSACKNQSVVVSVLYGPFNPYIPIRSTTIGKSRVARDPTAMHTSWRSNSDIASVTSVYGSSLTYALYRCLPAFYEIVTTQILLAEPLGSLAFKMVQVRQLMEEQQVELESADGWRCVYPRPTFSVS
ncbi:Soluble Starch synthase III-B (IC) [Dorcoceras hygrometricum]|uniref:Soluble Starch synthase III-B (IC) n=1 Tax=Dorcoceras hygrometricum TaxID=472368 RepID=A0A2Z7BIA4_9LAMI|nr:Soluble Starch synthase III-B (IC) [Dorcoceras hygrometricum]